MQIGAATVENSMELPQIFQMKLAYDWAIPSENISEEIQNTNLKEYIHPYVHCSIIYNNQDLETAQCPSVD